MKKQLLGFIACLIAFTTVAAQKIVPIATHDFLKPSTKNTLAPQPKMECNFEPLGNAIQLVAGDSTALLIDLDTVGLGNTVELVCQNCDELNAGRLRIADNIATYIAEATIEQAFDTVYTSYCNDAGECTAVFQNIIIVQRAPRSFSFPAEPLAPQESIDIIVPQHQLPGTIACRTFVDCEDNYLGTGQRFAFINSIQQNNDFRYDASRYGGADQVCFLLCNEYGLCDEYNYTFEIIRANVDLPFFDDFSIDGNRPQAVLWQNEDVLINRSFAIDPPSIGVATFDAVGSDGQPVGSSAGFSPRDYLTSTGINLANAGTTTLTFYVQARGLGNRPERIDSLVLEFLRPDGTWQHVWSMEGRSSGESNCSEITFSPQIVDVPDAYKYDGFQFRFFNYSSQSGSLDHWNLDYVKLSDNATGINLNDIALIQAPPTITAPYSALPYRQLVAAGSHLLRDTFEAGVWDHGNINELRSLPLANLGIIERSTSTVLIDENQIEALSSIPAGSPYIVQDAPDQSILATYQNRLLSLDNTSTGYSVTTTYDLNPFSANGQSIETTAPGFATSVQTNNVASTTTELGDFYAYDDGTAELAIEAQPGQTLVQKYEAFTDETLRGVSIRLPRVSLNNNSDLEIEILVYLGELTNGNTADYSMVVSPIYVEHFYADSLNGFTSYAFPDSINIPTGVFYIGWRQLGTCENCVAVGLDRNNIIPETRYFRNTENWFEFDGCSTGALMIRPLVGNSPIMISDVEDTSNTNTDIRIYPNPAKDFLHIESTVATNPMELTWKLYNLSGQLLRSGQANEINVTEYKSGMYLLQVSNPETGQLSYHKFIVE